MSGNSAFTEYCQETTFHGFLDYHNATRRPHGHWRGAFWIFLMILFTGIAFWEIAKVFMDFRESPIITSYVTKSENSLQFPVVQFCLTNSIDKRKLAELKLHSSIGNYAATNVGGIAEDFKMIEATLGADAKLKMLIEAERSTLVIAPSKEKALERAEALVRKYGLAANEADKILKQTEEELSQIFPNSSSDTDVFGSHHQELKSFLFRNGAVQLKRLQEAITFTPEEVFLNCEFENAKIDCPSKITTVFDSVFGRCYLLNLNQSQTFTNFGLTATIKLNTENAWDQIALANQGVYIKIMREYSPANLGVLAVKAGEKSHVTIKASHYDLRSSQKFGFCNDDMLRKVVTYPYVSSDVCRLECAHREFLHQCGCSMDVAREFLKHPKIYKNCMEIGESECLFNFVVQEDPKYKACVATCKPACEYWKYETQMSSTRFPSHSFAKQLQSCGIDPIEFAQDHVYLTVAYGDLEHLEVTQKEALSFDGFVGQIGGHLGLFLGASLVTLIQTIVFLIECACGKGKKSEEKEENSSIQSDETPKGKKRSRISNVYSNIDEPSYALPTLY